MLKNSSIIKTITKDKIKLMQKAILTSIGATSSKESIKKAANMIYADVQKIIKNLLNELKENGEIKTKEAKKIIQNIQRVSESEKTKIYKKLQKEGKVLIKSAREIILTPLSILKNSIKPIKKIRKTKNKKAKK